MSETENLKAEILRLQDILDDHGISHEVEVPEKPHFGPPTEWEWRMSQLFKVSAAKWATELGVKAMRDHAFLSGKTWPDISHLRIRLPTDFVVKQS